MMKSPKAFYKHICDKYPDVSYREDEDLSIENLYAQEVKRMWVNVLKYPRVIDIAFELKISDHTVYRLVKKHNMGTRKDYHQKNAYLK